MALNTFNAYPYPHVLNSFAYAGGLDKLEYVPENLTLDSGAFTAWNAGKSVDIHKYVEFCHKWMAVKPDLKAVNLDVIPGERGRTSTKAEREAGMEQSLKNADYLRGQGITIEEVFHQDEPFDFLDLLISRMQPNEVLGISPRNDVNKKQRIIWLKQILKHMVDKYGKDNIPKTHGLAVTNPDSINAFPFYSVDSSTYVNPMRFGAVIDEYGRGMSTKEYLGFNARGGKGKDASAMRLLIYRMMEYYKGIEKNATSTWKARGIDWDESRTNKNQA